MAQGPHPLLELRGCVLLRGWGGDYRSFVFKRADTFVFCSFCLYWNKFDIINRYKNMETLYRKYRPQKFSDVVGQDIVVSAIQTSLNKKKISHAYIFAGGRGTGKTSLARIFARALGVSSNDLYEIDAASNRGIDDIRAIKDAVFTLPFNSPYKMYLIDEAHMLTREAWNALLKTLEEPPHYVIFILATTELEKIPDTIMSRCEIHIFKQPDQHTLEQLIKNVAKEEGYDLPEEAVSLLALVADGSFRDAYGVLQKTLSSSDTKKISLAHIEKTIGAPDSVIIFDLLKALCLKQVESVFEILHKQREKDYNSKVFLRLLIERVRLAIMLRISPHILDHKIEEDTTKQLKEILQLKPLLPLDSHLLLNLLDTYDRVLRSSFPDITLEASLISLLE